MKRRPLALFSLLALALTLGGCGFHLRGQATHLAALDGEIYISGLERYSPLRREIGQALELAGARISEEPAGIPALRISDYRSTRRVLSVDRRNKVVEFELEEAFRFSLLSADGEERVPPQRLRTLRISLNPEVEVLGRAREEELLRRDMQRELARQLVTRLDRQL